MTELTKLTGPDLGLFKHAIQRYERCQSCIFSCSGRIPDGWTTFFR